MPTAGTRARPLSVEERQASIIDAVIPLLAVHGRDISSKQIAEAAGVAEGTVFRAFGDKDSIIAAAIARFLDPEPLRHELRAIDPEFDLHTKVLSIITIMQRRFGEIFRVMALVGHERPQHEHEFTTFIGIIADILAPELGELAWPADRIAHMLRLVSFASAFPRLNDGVEFTPGELTDMVLHGLVGDAARHHPHPTERQS